MSTLEGRVVVLTGATGGIGSAAARRYAELGAKLVVSDIDADKGAQLEKELQADGYDVTFVAGDVTQAATAQAVAEVVRDRHGRLDVLHNNAGVLIGKGVLETSDDEWDLMINVSLRGTFLMTRELVPLMEGQGVVTNMGSSLGLVGGAASAAYCAAKGAIINFTKAAACDFAPGVRVNAICPGGIDTNMPRSVVGAMDPETAKAAWAGLEAQHLLGRVGEVEEVVAVAAFLASDDASFINGAAIPVDGGWTAY